MNVFSSLPPAEQARQLANPDGAVGLQVAEWLNGNNAQANARVLDNLEIVPHCHVLEIGFGNGREATNVIARGEGVRYVGIDISPSMLEEAERFNARHIEAGNAKFHLTSAERIPYADATFDRVFSIGVIHFWIDPLLSLTEIRRVCRPGSLAVMGCLHPRSTLPFAKEEYGFHVRGHEEWAELFRAAGFTRVEAVCVEVAGVAADGTPNKRYTTRITARP